MKNTVSSIFSLIMPQCSFQTSSSTNIKKTIRKKLLEPIYFQYSDMAEAVLEHFSEGDVIINTGSVTAYRGSEHLVDYASTKGAIYQFYTLPSKYLQRKE